MINKIFTGIVLAGTILMIYIMSVTGKPLKTSASPSGILNLEFASTAAATANIVNAWEKEGLVKKAEINTYWDFIFLLFYSTLLFILCRGVSNRIDSKNFLNKTGKFLAAGALAAGMMDVLENGGMLASLAGLIRDNISLFTFTASVIKWSLVALCIFYIMVGTLYILFKKRKVYN
ncbi:MAG: hypothetical protein WAT19_01535 [Ferruginibacter sp.]